MGKLEEYIKGKPSTNRSREVNTLLQRSKDLLQRIRVFPKSVFSHIARAYTETASRSRSKIGQYPQLTARVEECIKNPSKEMVDVDQREIYALLKECPIRTIGIFHQICRKSQDRAYKRGLLCVLFHGRSALS